MTVFHLKPGRRGEPEFVEAMQVPDADVLQDGNAHPRNAMLRSKVARWLGRGASSCESDGTVGFISYGKQQWAHPSDWLLRWADGEFRVWGDQLFRSLYDETSHQEIPMPNPGEFRNPDGSRGVQGGSAITTQQTMWNTPKIVTTVHMLRNLGIPIPDEIPGHTMVEVPALQVSAKRIVPGHQ